jgi:hypothetical protein
MREPSVIYLEWLPTHPIDNFLDMIYVLCFLSLRVCVVKPTKEGTVTTTTTKPSIPNKLGKGTINLRKMFR